MIQTISVTIPGIKNNAAIIKVIIHGFFLFSSPIRKLSYIGLVYDKKVFA